MTVHLNRSHHRVLEGSTPLLTYPSFLKAVAPVGCGDMTYVCNPSTCVMKTIFLTLYLLSVSFQQQVPHFPLNPPGSALLFHVSLPCPLLPSEPSLAELLTSVFLLSLSQAIWALTMLLTIFQPLTMPNSKGTSTFAAAAPHCQCQNLF